MRLLLITMLLALGASNIGASADRVQADKYQTPASIIKVVKLIIERRV